MEFLNHLIIVISNLSASQAIGTAAVVLEFGLRMFKSDKPLSIMYMIADGFKKSGELLGKIGGLMDKVLPQRIK